jgi:hypothetical protein
VRRRRQRAVRRLRGPLCVHIARCLSKATPLLPPAVA